MSGQKRKFSCIYNGRSMGTGIYSEVCDMAEKIVSEGFDGVTVTVETPNKVWRTYKMVLGSVIRIKGKA